MAKTSNLDDLELMGDGEQFREELCTLIERAPMFSNLTRPEVQIMARYARAYEAKKGAIIFREGEKGHFMCVLLEGRVNILKETLEREQKKVATVRRGKSMGEMSMLDELPYSATAKAVEDTKLLMITKLNFERLSEEQPIVCNMLLRQIARLMSLRLRQTTGILLDYLSVDK
jgi:CRP-like cAMP-binding protein